MCSNVTSVKLRTRHYMRWQKSNGWYIIYLYLYNPISLTNAKNAIYNLYKRMSTNRCLDRPKEVSRPQRNPWPSTQTLTTKETSLIARHGRSKNQFFSLSSTKYCAACQLQWIQRSSDFWKLFIYRIILFKLVFSFSSSTGF